MLNAETVSPCPSGPRPDTKRIPYDFSSTRNFRRSRSRGSKRQQSMLCELNCSHNIMACSTKDLPDCGRALMSRFWPGPLTLIFRASSEVPHYIVSAQGNIGLRCPDHSVSHELLSCHGGPITCTSANISGHDPAKNAEEVAATFGSDLDLIIDGGMTGIKIASTVVDVSAAKIQILRKGAISSEEIEKALARRSHKRNNLESKDKSGN